MALEENRSTLLAVIEFVENLRTSLKRLIQLITATAVIGTLWYKRCHTTLAKKLFV